MTFYNDWSPITNCIINVRMTDTDGKSYLDDSPEDTLAKHEQQKTRKYVNSCLKQQSTFTPFILSVDGLLRREANSLLKAISTHLAKKMGPTLLYSVRVCQC